MLTRTKPVELLPFGTATIRSLTRGEVRSIRQLGNDDEAVEKALEAAVVKFDWHPEYLERHPEFEGAEVSWSVDLDNALWMRLQDHILDLGGLTAKSDPEEEPTPENLPETRSS